MEMTGTMRLEKFVNEWATGCGSDMRVRMMLEKARMMLSQVHPVCLQ